MRDSGHCCGSGVVKGVLETVEGKMVNRNDKDQSRD